MSRNCPLVTVITIVYNGEDSIEKTMVSVLNQTSKDMEYIVIDGMSKDNTKEIIRKYSPKITWISEPDMGISDAFNKGIKRAKGKWLLFLNSGDIFVNNEVLEKVSEYLLKYEDTYSTVFGKIIISDAHGNWLKEYGNTFNRRKFFRGNCIPHQASFIQRSFFEKNGLYDLEYKRVMDFELFLRDKAFNPKFIDMTVAEMLVGGVSQKDFYLLLKETRDALHKNGYPLQWTFIFYQMIKLTKYKIRHSIFRLQSKMKRIKK